MPSEHSALLTTLRTVEDRALLQEELRILEDAVFQTKKNSFSEVLETRVRAPIATIIASEIREQQQKPEQYLQHIAAQLNDLPILELTIAFSPTAATIRHVADTATTLFATPLLVKLRVQPEVIGGAVIVWQGKYHDASLQSAFRTAMEKIKAPQT